MNTFSETVIGYKSHCTYILCWDRQKKNSKPCEESINTSRCFKTLLGENSGTSKFSEKKQMQLTIPAYLQLPEVISVKSEKSVNHARLVDAEESLLTRIT